VFGFLRPWRSVYNRRMYPAEPEHPQAGFGTGHFATTQWSLVLVAAAHVTPESREALAELCNRYWYPLYA
jgi:hypothetical protein